MEKHLTNRRARVTLEEEMAIECQHGQLARSCLICELETEVMRLETELKEVSANAARYELMRDMKLYEMQQYRCLPVQLEESHDWFDAQIDAKIRERYPNAVIGE